MPETLDIPIPAPPAMPGDNDESGENDSGALLQAAEGKDYIDLPEDRIQQLRSLSNKLDLRDQWARQIEVLRTALLRFFWIGLQHVWWNQDVGMYQVGQSGAGQAVPSEDLNDESTFSEDFNIYTGYGKSFIAVFAQNAAPVRMEPDKPKDDASIKAAAEAQKYVRVYEKYNPPQLQQIDIGRLLFNDGRVVAWTKFESDGRFGWEQKEDGTRQARATETTRWFGVLESKVPIYESEFCRWVYCKLSGDHDLLDVKERYPDFASKISLGQKSTNSNEEIARMSRIATAENVTQLSQDTLAHLITEDNWFYRASAFWDLEDDDRQWWQKQFPEGLRATFCGSTFCGAYRESMDDHLRVMHASPGNGQSRPAAGQFEAAVQMEFNDAMNLMSELLKFTIPSTWVDMSKEELAAVAEQVAQYGAYRPFSKGNGQPLTNFFFSEPQTEPPAFMAEWLQNLQGPLSQFITGQQPALFGAQMEDQKTAKGYAMARDQALGLMAIVWIPFTQFYAGIVEQAARLAAKREAETISALVPAASSRNADKQEVLDINIADMRGGFLASPQSDANFPESWTAKSNKFMQLMAGETQNPWILAMMTEEPDNLAMARDLYGLEELVIPGADSRDKQLAEWAEMQQNKTGPVKDVAAMQAKYNQLAQVAAPAAAQTGQLLPPFNPTTAPPIYVSSIPIDPETDNNKVEFEEGLRILNSPEAQKLKQSGPEGLAVWQDLKVHTLAHKAAMAAQIPPPMPMPPKPGAAPGPLPPAGAPPQTPPLGAMPNA